MRRIIDSELPVLLRAARATGLDSAQAEDAVQSTFLTFIQRAQDFDGRARVRTWLFGILYKKIQEARRTIRKDRQFEDIDEVMEQRFRSSGHWSLPPREADAIMRGEEIREWIAECLEELPVRQRSAFVLREVEGMATEEICNVLEITRNNLGVLLYRGRNRLRECLEAKGLQRSADADL